MCLCCASVPVSDEEEGAVLFDSSGKAAADPFDTSSGSVQLIAMKPTALPMVQPTSDRSQEPTVLNGEVSTGHPEPETGAAMLREPGLATLGTACVQVYRALSVVFTSTCTGLSRMKQGTSHVR